MRVSYHLVNSYPTVVPVSFQPCEEATKLDARNSSAITTVFSRLYSAMI